MSRSRKGGKFGEGKGELRGGLLEEFLASESVREYKKGVANAPARVEVATKIDRNVCTGESPAGINGSLIGFENEKRGT